MTHPISKIDFSLTPRIFKLAIPVIATAQMDNVVGIATLYMVGKLGPGAISTVGISWQIIVVIMVTMMAITTGTFALVAQAIGAGSARDASAITKQAITLMSILSVGISLFGIVATPTMLTFLSVPPDVADLAKPYLEVFFASLILIALTYTQMTCFYAAGNTRTPLYIILITNVITIIASYGFIFGVWGLPTLGVVGSAYGMIVGRVLSVAFFFWALYSGRFAITLLPDTSYRLNRDLAGRILKIGIPAGLQGLFRNGSGLIFLKFVALTTASTAALAAFSIGNQVERVVRRTSLSFGTVATTLVGQSIGAKDPDEAERRGWTTLVISILSLALMGLPVIFFAYPTMALFTDASDVIAIGVLYLYAIALSEPFMCAATTAGGGLQGAGDTVPALVYTLVSQWLIRLPAAYILAFPLGYDTTGLWIALVIFSALQGILTARKFLKGEWKTRRI
jgi:putative MATE family efflux protein